MRAVRKAPRAIAILLSVLALAPVALSDAGALHERRIDRIVATPTPLGPVLAGSDEARYLLDIPESVVVEVRAEGPAHALFYLSHHRADRATRDLALPASYQTILVPGPGQWIVRVDPAGGADFHARLVFRGYVSDVGGAPGAFDLVDAGRDGACVVAGTCLP